jgi:hypothetical protein
MNVDLYNVLEVVLISLVMYSFIGISETYFTTIRKVYTPQHFERQCDIKGKFK